MKDIQQLAQDLLEQSEELYTISTIKVWPNKDVKDKSLSTIITEIETILGEIKNVTAIDN
jgi:DNA-binding winged helix-turn-helix (wHTH) protein